MARPIGWGGRLTKWARRRPAVASLIGVSGLAVVLFLAAALWFTERLAVELQTPARHMNALWPPATSWNWRSPGRWPTLIDADFRQLEMIPQSIAALLAQRERYDEQELEGWTRTLVEKERRIFGIGIALEPRQFGSFRRA